MKHWRVSALATVTAAVAASLGIYAGQEIEQNQEQQDPDRADAAENGRPVRRSAPTSFASRRSPSSVIAAATRASKAPHRPADRSSIRTIRP